MLRPTAAIEIGRSGRSRKTLNTRTDRDCDHVLLQSLVVADAGVATGREHIDKALLGNHLESDLRVGGEKLWHHRREHESYGADRNVEPERARGSLAKSVHHIQRRFHFGQGRTESVQQTLAGFRWNHTSRRSIEEPHAKLGFQAADGFT